MKQVLMLGMLVSLAGCGTGPLVKFDPGARVIGPIETAHGKAAWQSHDAVRFDIDLSMGGKQILDATIVFEIGRERVRLVAKDGSYTAVWDGNDAWYWPADAEMPGPPPRFHLRTWTYFLAAPFKLRDPGTHLSPVDLRDAGPYTDQPAGKLTFGENVGDSPDDWYIVFRHPKHNTLSAMAYIVTYGKPAEKAEKEPHAIVYDGYERIDGVTLSTDWTFKHWSQDKGIHGDAIGKATIRNIRFMPLQEGEFDHPDNAAKDTLPE